MPIDTFKYGKTAAEVVIEHLIDEIKVVKPFVDDLTQAFCERKCIAAWDLLENLRLAAENFATQHRIGIATHAASDGRSNRCSIIQIA